MAVIALTTAIWPAVAVLVSGLLVTVLGAGASGLLVLGTRWVRGELAWRRELRTLPPVDAAPYGAAAPTPTFAELRESA
jgi:hypothetical protein